VSTTTTSRPLTHPMPALCHLSGVVSLLSLCLLVIAAGSGGCGRSDVHPPPAAADTDTTGASAHTAAANTTSSGQGVSVARVRTDDPAWLTDRDDPAGDGWDTEVFNAAAGVQLKVLAKLLEHAEAIELNKLEALATPAFTCNALRPSDLEVVFEDQSLIVRRAPKQATPGRSGDPSDGPPRLLNALTQLAQPLPGEIRVKFKLFRVEPGEAAITTHVYYEASGHADDAVVQHNAVWICAWQSGSPDQRPRLSRIQVADFEEVATRGTRRELFADCTRAVLGHNACFKDQLLPGREHWLRRVETTLGLESAGHTGLAVGDVNGDGLEDVYVAQSAPFPNRLFVQNADGTATDIAAQATVDFLDHTRGVLIVDLNNDGRQDIVLALSPALLIFAGDGRGGFEQVATLDAPNAVSLAAADYDLDGDLDIFACRYSITSLYERSSGFTATPIPYHDANNGAANTMFRNDGDWTFTDVTHPVGLDENNTRFSFAASWEDYDNDGDLDLYVANDYGRNNLYRNSNGRFEDVAASAGVEDIATGMSADWADYNRDGWMDLYVGNMFSSAGNRIAYQRQFHRQGNEVAKAHLQRTARGNSLFANDGRGGFTDVSETAAVTMGRWAWASPFVDLNNDGWEDLVVANGFVTNRLADDL